MSTEEGEASLLRRSTRQRKVVSTPNDDDSAQLAKRAHKTSASRTQTEYIPKTSAEPRSREGRLHGMAGSDESLKEDLFDRLEKWKKVFENVPDELLDYTIGWGVCTGDWDGKGGDRQKSKTFSYSSLKVPFLTVVVPAIS
jgi:hypothetical protein